VNWLRKIIGSNPRDRVRMLAVLPSPEDRVSLSAIASREGWSLRMASHCDSALEILRHHPADLIVCARDVKPSGWRDALTAMAAQAPGTCLILVSPETDDRLWLEVIERGGFDVVTTPLHAARVVQAVRQALKPA
jgi:DNA-binding NtrC family response regulator